MEGEQLHQLEASNAFEGLNLQIMQQVNFLEDTLVSIRLMRKEYVTLKDRASDFKAKRSPHYWWAQCECDAFRKKGLEAENERTWARKKLAVLRQMRGSMEVWAEKMAKKERELEQSLG